MHKRGLRVLDSSRPAMLPREVLQPSPFDQLSSVRSGRRSSQRDSVICRLSRLLSCRAVNRHLLAGIH